MELQKNSTFDENTMATTVGANSLNVETVVSQPCSDQNDLMVDGLDYVFDQAKFEDYLSFSSSKSSSPRKLRRISTSKKEVRSVIVRSESHNNTPANYKAESSAHHDSIQNKESSFKTSTALTKRARQRQRQKLARQIAKALESTDGVHYSPSSRQQNTTPHPGTTPAKEEWVLVKRTCLTKKERAQKRRARAARARAILHKAQESKSAKGPIHQIWIPKSAQNRLQDSACTRDSVNCRAESATVQTVAPTARQFHLSRQPRGSLKCRARTNFSRDVLNCRGQESPSSFVSSGDIPTTSRSISVFSRLGPLPRVPVHERLGHTRRHTGGRAQNLADVQRCPGQAGISQDSRLPVASRLSIPQGVRETVVGKNSKRTVIREVMRNDNTIVIHARNNSLEKRPKVSSQHPQRKTCHQKDVTLGGGSLTHHQAEGDNMRKRTIDQIDCSCSCAHLIKTLLSGCACSESKSFPQRASVFERLSLPAIEDSKPESRRFRRRRGPVIQSDEFSEVIINMVSKGKGTATEADPDFTPGGRVGSRISRRMSRLQLRATKRIDYRRMHEGESSEDESSDDYSAIASDDTMSSIGQAREAYTITPETLAQMLQEALTKQKEELRAEMKMEMELAMQQMRELQSQKAVQPESSQQGGSSRRVAHDIEDSDTEVDEHILADQLPKKTAEGLNHPTGGGLKQEEDDSGKMKELEGKINALLSAQEVKKTAIPCPYPKEWDSIPYPSKFSLINFTPFDGKGSPTQHLIYFKSHLGVISGNEPLMVRSFVGTLRGAAFDWYRRLKTGSINCWDDMESSFLSNFFDDDTEVSIRTLLDEKQKGGETTDAFVKRFRNKAINCKDPITEEFILQTCHNNLSIDLLEVMGVVPPTTWKELKLRGEQAERFLKRKKNERGEPTTGLSNSNLVSRSEKNASTIAVDQKLQQQYPRQRKTSDRRLQKDYSFKDEEVPVIFKHLLENNKIKLPPITNQEETDNTSDPNYCAYHRRILHPTKDCLALKAIIQALIEAGVLTPK